MTHLPTPTVDSVTPAAETKQDQTIETIMSCPRNSRSHGEGRHCHRSTSLQRRTGLFGQFEAPLEDGNHANSDMLVAPHVVRVTNTDEIMCGDFSPFVVT